MRTFGLIGKSLTHSFSQQYFTEKFQKQNINDAEYRLFSLAKIEEIKNLLKHPTLHGFNVTIPYKTAIIPYLDELDIVAQEVGAVNCVVKRNNKWVGYNTEVVGFEKLLQKAESSASTSLSNQKAEEDSSSLLLFCSSALLLTIFRSSPRRPFRAIRSLAYPPAIVRKERFLYCLA